MALHTSYYHVEPRRRALADNTFTRARHGEYVEYTAEDGRHANITSHYHRVHHMVVVAVVGTAPLARTDGLSPSLNAHR